MERGSKEVREWERKRAHTIEESRIPPPKGGTVGFIEGSLKFWIIHFALDWTLLGCFLEAKESEFIVLNLFSSKKRGEENTPPLPPPKGGWISLRSHWHFWIIDLALDWTLGGCYLKQETWLEVIMIHWTESVQFKNKRREAPPPIPPPQGGRVHWKGIEIIGSLTVWRWSHWSYWIFDSRTKLNPFFIEGPPFIFMNRWMEWVRWGCQFQ